MFNSPTRQGFSSFPRPMSNLGKEKMSAPNNAYYVLTQVHAGLPNSVLFDDEFAAKDTDNLTEGAINLYFTNARVGTYGDVAYLKLDGSNANSNIDIGAFDLTTTGAVEAASISTTGPQAYHFQTKNVDGNRDLFVARSGTGDGGGDDRLCWWQYKYNSATSSNLVLWLSNDGAGTQDSLVSFDYINGVGSVNFIDNDVKTTGTIQGGNYKSGDGSAGITQSETGVTDFDIVIKDGLITSFTKNA